MKNERGITLIEILAVILLISTVSLFLFSVLTSGVTNVKRTSTKQTLQQEGHYITEVIRNEYLESGDNSIELVVDNVNRKLYMDGNEISSGFTYELNDADNDSSPVTTVTFSNTDHFHLLLKIKEKDHCYEVNTTLTKLN